jgi:ligand-binding sensor domain-containing protein
MRGLLLLLLILFAWSGSAQNFTQFHYDMSNGLPDNKVTSVFQDSRGFMWFAFDYGLTRFDGVNFRNYYSTSEISLAPSQAGSITETAPGHLAMVCSYKLITLNTNTHQLNHAPAFINREIYGLNPISKNQFFVSTIDTCFLTDQNFNILDIIVTPADSTPRPANGYELERGMYLVGDILKYYLYNVKEKKLEPFYVTPSGAPMDYLDFQFYDSANQWLYFANYFTGVFRYSLQGEKLKHWSISGQNIVRPVNNRFLWLGSSAGYSAGVLNIEAGEVTLFKISGESDYKAFQFYKDVLGNFWVASDVGVTRLKANDQLIETWDNFDMKLSRDIFPLTLLKGKDQRMHLSLFNSRFLYQFDHGNGEWKLISKNLVTGVWCANEIGNDLVFTGGGTRFTLYNSITGALRHSTDFLKTYFPNSDILILAFQHSNGDQWFSANKGGGFVRVSAADKKIHHYTKDGPRGKFTWSYYTSYVEDDSGDLWFGVNKKPYLLHWTKKTDSFSEVMLDTIPGHVGKGHGGINRIIRDDQNNLWIGFDGSGIVKYDHTHNRAVHYTYQDGLGSGTVSSMTFDSKGRLWMGTPNGLNCLLVKENKIRTFTKVDGLKDDEFRDICMYYDSAENKLWVGATTAVMRFDPDALLANPTQEVNVYLDEIHINGKQRFHDPQEELNLSFEENNIHFRFVAVNLDRREIQLSYQLEGQNDSWVSSLTGTSATYANLDPGRYTFTVKANYRGALDEPILSKPFTFVVATPWFMTWWFRLLVVVSSVLSMIFLIRLYYSRKTEKQRLILEKEQAVEKERTRIATDMHDDFGANLSRIKFISEKIKLKSENESQLNKDLQKFLITAMRWLKR